MIKSESNTINRLKELLNNLRYLDNLENNTLVDVKKIGFVTPLSITPVAAMINKKGLKHNYEGENSSYLDTIRFPGGIDFVTRTFLQKTYLPIIHLGLDRLKEEGITRTLGALHTRYLELLKTNIVADIHFIELITNNTFGFLLGEIFDNIQEHAKASNVYLFAQHWPKINSCEVCVIDDGQGLYGSLKKVGRDVKDPLDALRKILETGLSAKDEYGQIKRGTGIKHTRAALTNKEINGEFLIMSGDAIFIHSAIEGENFFRLTNYQWKGTIIMMRLNRPVTPFNLYDYVK